ncbi:hypothetical protein KIW74_gp38 [Mycobacterium phage Kimona]|uniref:Uncharacterized protein n=1 Tax=Mycobacterium phage Kimona TaxID=2024295 RepID=A0A249XU37_9CAUD|nr:hypothetical protein KIW74_gp38 [Mycobacterium phage Kimona]ASZ75490.1 hypothetical protein PBI_KIMONA_54 [Mycobacterium phage Kimona]
MPEGYTEAEWLGFKPGAPTLPYREEPDYSLIHDYVWEGDADGE